MEGSPWTDSEETGKPFSHCMRCKQPLDAEREPWLVNKEYRMGECILEFAICRPCRGVVTEGLSPDSRESVKKFVEQEISPRGRVARGDLKNDFEGRFDTCVSCGRSREELERFGISALLDSFGLVAADPLPLLICHFCTARMTEKISGHSKQVWGEFLGEHLEGPQDGSGFHGMI